MCRVSFLRSSLQSLAGWGRDPAQEGSAVRGRHSCSWPLRSHHSPRDAGGRCRATDGGMGCSNRWECQSRDLINTHSQTAYLPCWNPYVCFCFQEAGSVPCPLLAGGRPLPTLDVKPPERRSSRSKDPPREEERERKKKKHKKRSRTRSRSPKYHSSSKSRSRSHSKAKHCLPSAYRTARRSRWVCRASPRPGVGCGADPAAPAGQQGARSSPPPARCKRRPQTSTPACLYAEMHPAISYLFKIFFNLPFQNSSTIARFFSKERYLNS